MKTYKMTIAGCTRELPLCPVSDDLDIAAFIMFNDVEITKKSAEELLKRCPEFDILLTAEAKGIPLCYEMAALSNKPYLVARKCLKVYITNPITVTYKSITTKKEQTLHLSCKEGELIKGKRILIVDDVISTGDSLQALESLVEIAGGTIVGKTAVLAEGEAINREDIIYLEQLPLFPKN